MDFELIGVYQCKNNEVIEVLWDEHYKGYRLCFQIGGAPIILNKENTIKLLKSYNAYKVE